MSSYQYPPMPPQPGAYPPPQQPGAYPPQQAPGYPPQAPGAYPPPQVPGYPPQGYQQASQQPAPPSGPPPVYAVNDQDLADQYRRTKEELQRGGGAGFLKVPGPQGQTKWDSGVPIGYEGSVFVHICGPWAEGKPIFARKKKYFWKSRSKPQGTSIIVPESGDLVSEAIELAGASADPVVQQFLKDFGKPRVNYLYNVLQLDNPQIHVGQDGVMRPLILDEGKQCHSRIGDVFSNAEGASKIVDYQNGRPIRLVRKKTGPRNMDIEWQAMPAMNPAPVPEQFWPALNNLWDLEKFVKVATAEEQQQAILDMGLPFSGQTVQMQVPASYNPGVAPPYPNPHQQQPPPPMPVTPPASFGPPPAFAPPPVYSQGQAQMPSQVAQAVSPQSVPPPGLNPPPISSQNPQMPQNFGPPPVPSAAPTANPLPQQAAPQTEQPMQRLSLPLPPGTALPEGRERCFGQFNQTDNFCIQCPDWVKSQCQGLTPQQSAQGADGGLQALQQQLQG